MSSITAVTPFAEGANSTKLQQGHPEKVLKRDNGNILGG